MAKQDFLNGSKAITQLIQGVGQRPSIVLTFGLLPFDISNIIIWKKTWRTHWKGRKPVAVSAAVAKDYL